jgi:23S rRNA (cytosine1962-C5)-methyltransferase
MKQVVINSKLKNKIKQGHLWIFSGAVEQISDDLTDGEVVEVICEGESIATGYFNSKTDIVVRVLAQGAVDIDKNYFLQRFKAAAEIRKSTLAAVDSATTMYRLINAEGDFCPGLIVDKYGDYLVLQVSTLGMERLLPVVIESLQEVFSPKGILVRNDVAVRGKEGLVPSGFRWEGTPSEVVTAKENGLEFEMNIQTGQKTGFFLDQRDKRALVGALAKGRSVLNLFSYSCGFGVYAAAAGASSTLNVDQSAAALALGQKNYKLNDIDVAQHGFLEADIFNWLRDQESITQDIVVVDPPALAKSRKAKEQAELGYFKFNSQVFSKIKKETYVLTCSCSNYITLDEFKGLISRAGRVAGRRIQLITALTHASDHPVNLAMPETEYLKSLLLKVSI